MYHLFAEAHQAKASSNLLAEAHQAITSTRTRWICNHSALL